MTQYGYLEPSNHIVCNLSHGLYKLLPRRESGNYVCLFVYLSVYFSLTPCLACPESSEQSHRQEILLSIPVRTTVHKKQAIDWYSTGPTLGPQGLCTPLKLTGLTAQSSTLVSTGSSHVLNTRSIMCIIAEALLTSLVAWEYTALKYFSFQYEHCSRKTYLAL
jgi:hypothetical protein